ncbi:hypothetical protein BGX33_011384 [Mortierella sp. NVP41]|nr:hypothetical protein BGX33_011384 [Mortierella sp. NVP41]
MSPKGYLYIKNGSKVTRTNDSRAPTLPKDIDDYDLTKTNSFVSLDSINPGTIFKSTDGKTKMKYSKVCSLCIYNKNGYNTWYLDSPFGYVGKMRGGGHYLRDRNTLRAGATSQQDGDLRSDNDRYSIYAHNQGGLLGDNSNLCVEKKSGGALRHINVYKSDDKYLLYMENNGHAYVYRPDGNAIWYS